MKLHAVVSREDFGDRGTHFHTQPPWIAPCIRIMGDASCAGDGASSARSMVLPLALPPLTARPPYCGPWLLSAAPLSGRTAGALAPATPPQVTYCAELCVTQSQVSGSWYHCLRWDKCVGHLCASHADAHQAHCPCYPRRENACSLYPDSPMGHTAVR